LIKNVDKACDEIKSCEKKLDLLFMSPGYLSFDGRNGNYYYNAIKLLLTLILESTEGIDIPHALRYYTRLRFAFNLLPLLNASSSPRIVSILAGGKEVALVSIFETYLPLKLKASQLVARLAFLFGTKY
jgi:hypothetical protein